MKNLNQLLSEIKNKKESNRLESYIEQYMSVGIKDCFRISQLCVFWSTLNDNAPAYEFRAALEAHTSRGDYGMTLDKYLESMKEIEITKLHAIDTLMNVYAYENNTVKIGDIAQDRMGKVLIEKVEGIHINQFTREPSLIFYGKELKLDGKPKKNGASRVIYQSNFNRDKDDKNGH